MPGSPRRPMHTYTVHVTIAEERRITVRAHNAEEARRRVSDGKYLRLGRALTRGFLLVGVAERTDA